MDERPSYRGIKSDYYTHCHDLPPQVITNYIYITHFVFPLKLIPTNPYYAPLIRVMPQIGRCLFLPEAAPFTAEIDGGAWSVTMSPSDCFEPMLPLDVSEACRDAARQVSWFLCVETVHNLINLHYHKPLFVSIHNLTNLYYHKPR